MKQNNINKSFTASTVLFLCYISTIVTLLFRYFFYKAECDANNRIHDAYELLQITNGCTGDTLNIDVPKGFHKQLAKLNGCDLHLK